MIKSVLFSFRMIGISTLFGKKRVEKIVDMYSQNVKQVFISIDRISSYDVETQDKIKNHTVLELGRGGRELFGRSWNEK